MSNQEMSQVFNAPKRQETKSMFMEKLKADKN
jgi:hypothetical protein